MIRMPAEWEKQRVVLLSFPHEETDWHNTDKPAELEASPITLYPHCTSHSL